MSVELSRPHGPLLVLLPRSEQWICSADGEPNDGHSAGRSISERAADGAVGAQGRSMSTERAGKASADRLLTSSTFPWLRPSRCFTIKPSWESAHMANHTTDERSGGRDSLLGFRNHISSSFFSDTPETPLWRLMASNCVPWLRRS